MLRVFGNCCGMLQYIVVILEDNRDHRWAERLAVGLQCLHNIVDRQVLFTQRNDIIRASAGTSVPLTAYLTG